LHFLPLVRNEEARLNEKKSFVKKYLFL